MIKQKAKIILVVKIVFGILCLWAGAIFILPFTVYGATDPFYRHGDDIFDVDLNFPILKPYYASAYPKDSPSHHDFSEYIWVIDLQGGKNNKLYDSIQIQLRNVLKIAVENGNVLVYAPDLSPEMMNWYVLNTKDGSELGFKKQSEFDDYIKQHGLESPIWLDIDDLHTEFNVTGCLDWFPNCRKIPPLFRFSPSLFESYQTTTTVIQKP